MPAPLKVNCFTASPACIIVLGGRDARGPGQRSITEVAGTLASLLAFLGEKNSAVNVQLEKLNAASDEVEKQLSAIAP